MPDTETLRRFIMEAVNGCEDQSKLYNVWLLSAKYLTAEKPSDFQKKPSDFQATTGGIRPV